MGLGFQLESNMVWMGKIFNIILGSSIPAESEHMSSNQRRPEKQAAKENCSKHSAGVGNSEWHGCIKGLAT